MDQEAAEDLLPRRLAAQQLRQSQPSVFTTGEALVHWLVGIQAQNIAGARWSIGLRLPRLTDQEVQREIDNRRIVRTWAFRGTLHYLAASDLPQVTALVAPIVIAANKRRYKQLELDEAAFTRANGIISRALEGGRQLIRSEIVDHLEQGGVSAFGQRAPYLLQRSALDGVICQGPQQGSEPTYVMAAEWIDPGTSSQGVPGMTPAELAECYFASHGPASPQDFAWWSGLPAKQFKEAAIDPASGGAMGPRAANPQSPCAHLLPPFDGYLLAYKDRDAVLDPKFKKTINPGGGMLKPTVLVDGRVAGIWKPSIKTQGVNLRIELFRRLDPGETDAVEAAASRYGAFYNKSVVIELISA